MLTLRFLGGFEVWVDGAPAACSPAPGRLLCRLAIDAGRPLLRGPLCLELWPDSDTTDVLDTNLQRVRRVLGSESNRLHTDHRTVLLDLVGADADFLRFQALTDDGSERALEEAVGLYRGEFLKRYLDEPWLLDLRDDLKTRFEDALKTLAERALAEGNLLIAARHLRRFVESNPDYEWGWVKLLETYVGGGNRAEALAAYAAYGERAATSRLPLSPRVEQAVARVREAPVVRDEAPTVGGALPPTSPFYAVRAEDRSACNLFVRSGATVHIKGPRQVGKSSLLARALQRCRESGMLVLHTDWQNLSHDALSSVDGFYQALAYRLADQAGIDSGPASVYREGLTAGDNFDRFVQRILVPAANKPIVWAIDEADRIFGCSFRDEVFGKLRAWHNDRALDPDSPWARFSLALCYSTEARLFIANLNQSPFNVGTVLVLKDFMPEQTADLNTRYGSPFSSGELDRLQALVGGHPYLTSRALYEARSVGLDLEALEAAADQPDSIFADHLERLRFALSLNPTLADTVRAHLVEGAPPTVEPFLRLCAAGVMVGAAPAQMTPRCRLYDRYLRRVLA